MRHFTASFHICLQNPVCVFRVQPISTPMSCVAGSLQIAKPVVPRVGAACPRGAHRTPCVCDRGALATRRATFQSSLGVKNDLRHRWHGDGGRWQGADSPRGRSEGKA